MYFELDLDGQLNEFQERKEMGVEILTMSIAEVPEGRQRTPYLVSRFRFGIGMVCSRVFLRFRRSVVLILQSESFPWILTTRSRP